MRQLLPGEEIFEDYLHPMLFWGKLFISLIAEKKFSSFPKFRALPDAYFV
jgi:hypothetical protein